MGVDRAANAVFMAEFKAEIAFDGHWFVGISSGELNRVADSTDENPFGYAVFDDAIGGGEEELIFFYVKLIIYIFA
ncbi:MAG: hypothetical protein NC218_08825 [Acetobacter sp.]|nr:hypothetical protein [Acetobacter sp.]